jgi:hypothetical protein
MFALMGHFASGIYIYHHLQPVGRCSQGRTMKSSDQGGDKELEFEHVQRFMEIVTCMWLYELVG